MQMRPSRVLRLLRAGKVAISFKVNLADPRATELAASAGYDCVWTCLEHVPNSLFAIEQQVYAAKSYDVDLLVRVARGSYSDYIRPLEMDAAGIMVPHLMSAADARQVVRMTRFQPIGRRPVDGGNADGSYCRVPFLEYIAQANRERFIVVQIEDPEPLAELDAIASVEGIDMLLFGPGDFSHSIGHPGEFEHPQVLDARRRVVEAALAHGKFAGIPASPVTLPQLYEMGYRFFNLGADVIAIGAYCDNMLKDAAKSLPQLRQA